MVVYWSKMWEESVLKKEISSTMDTDDWLVSFRFDRESFFTLGYRFFDSSDFFLFRVFIVGSLFIEDVRGVSFEISSTMDIDVIDLYHSYLDVRWIFTDYSFNPFNWSGTMIIASFFWMILILQSSRIDKIRSRKRPMKFIYFFHVVFTSQIHVLASVDTESKIFNGVFARVILRVNMYNWREYEHAYTLLANPKGGENPACPCFFLPLLIAFRLSRYQKRFPTTDISLTTKE